jgi:type IV pilus assembly protein PilW
MSRIEIMVGVAIALVTTLVIFQVFANSNASNRSTSAGNEAQISGNLGMFRLERDLKVAGMGFGKALTAMSITAGVAPTPYCTVHAYNAGLVPPQFTFPLVHVLITPGAAGVSDQIDVLYGNSESLTFGRRQTASNTLSTSTQSAVGINQSDLVIVTDFQAGSTTVPPAHCKLVEITAAAVLPSNTVGHDSANSTRNDPAPALADAVIPAGTLYDLGRIDPNPQNQSPSLNRWRIVNNTLQFSNLLGDGAVSTVAEGVVLIRAQYGVDDGAAGTAVAGDGIVGPTEWTSVPPANWSQVLAVRFALLARSGQLEKAVGTATVTTAEPAWVGGNFDMRAMPSDWRNYRYRVYESTVVMRNMIWGP